MSEIELHIQYLRAAELQFRMASAVRLATTFQIQPTDLPITWSHGKHVVRFDEIALSEDEADRGAYHFHRSATFLMAVAMKDSIRAAVHDPKNHSDTDIRSAYQISRLIRNAFSHAPFNPVWSIDPDCRNRVFAVPEVLALDTTGLHDQPFDWRHYGGPLAVLRLSSFVRTEILHDQQSPAKVIPMPQTVYVQQGDLIFKRIGDVPSDGPNQTLQPTAGRSDV